MSEQFDLGAYLARIGYDGPRTPELATLRAVHALHPASIPFENLDPLLGRPVRLDLTALQDKLVAGGRGGYCFEHNTLFAAALEALGFAVTRLGGRVRWNHAPGQPDGPRTHMLLRVDLPEGAYLADVGFGGHLLTEPLRLEPDTEQPNAESVVRLAATGGAMTVQVKVPNGWRDAYRFTPEPQLPPDYVVANWFTSTNPASLFLGNLLIQRVTPEARHLLFNTRLTTLAAGESPRERVVGSAEELAEALAGTFGLDAAADAGTVWARIPKQ